jgi:hypothetical protein
MIQLFITKMLDRARKVLGQDMSRFVLPRGVVTTVASLCLIEGHISRDQLEVWKAALTSVGRKAIGAVDQRKLLFFSRCITSASTASLLHVRVGYSLGTFSGRQAGG